MGEDDVDIPSLNSLDVGSSEECSYKSSEID